MPAFNPYLPSWEYIPDGEPHRFGDRVYVYGSHDRAGGFAYCLNDYVCWSAPINDLSDWRYEGVIYGRADDPLNASGASCLYAPDVTQGPDGRYYLYYVLDRECCVSVAVCDTPAGRYRFYGYVRDESGALLGHRPGDEPQFDPGVLTEGELTYLYTGFCPAGDKGRSGPMVTVLGPDMLTIRRGPETIMPSRPYSAGSGYEGHEFFEASSIRKLRGRYYFVYSSINFHELCYAVSDRPDGGFRYGGVIVSNSDLHISAYKPADMPAYYGGNNHGGILELDGKFYIFYHRHTHGTNFSRQGLAERVEIAEDGSIAQVAMTSCGLNGGPLPGRGEYPAHIACNLFNVKNENAWTGGSHGSGFWLDGRLPRIMQDGRDGDKEPAYIANMTDGSVCGFKFFDMKGVRRISLRVRGYARGAFEVRTAWDGPALCSIPLAHSTLWTDCAADVSIPDGVHALYLAYVGPGNASLLSFRLIADGD